MSVAKLTRPPRHGFSPALSRAPSGDGTAPSREQPEKQQPRGSSPLTPPPCVPAHPTGHGHCPHARVSLAERAAPARAEGSPSRARGGSGAGRTGGWDIACCGRSRPLCALGHGRPRPLSPRERTALGAAPGGKPRGAAPCIVAFINPNTSGRKATASPRLCSLGGAWSPSKVQEPEQRASQSHSSLVSWSIYHPTAAFISGKLPQTSVR